MSEIKLNAAQIELIKTLDLSLTVSQLETLYQQDELGKEDLITLLKVSNAAYRAGFPIIDDASYDAYHKQLQNVDPDNEFLAEVEPEVVVEGKTVTLPERMLSTDKAYSFDEIKRWINRILKAAEQLNIADDEIQIRVTPKLDGYAAYDDGERLYTRGDGYRGQDISRAFDRGLQVAGDAGRGLGPGEIVISQSYFNQVLSEHFENSRNIQAAIIAEKKVDENVQKAIDDGACVFYPFRALNNWTGSVEQLLTDFDEILASLWTAVDYDIDGLILETTHEMIKNHMGATRKFHRWQIAYKINAETADVEVIKVVPQTSRTGRVSPVAELVPTKLSGATLSRATVHHYNMVKSNGVGPGAIVRLVRSGLVIPKIEEVITPAKAELPEFCPSCETHLIWEADHLMCPNKTDCPAQTENTLIHFFKTLGNVDGFGPKVIEKISAHGIKHIHQIYQLTKEDFVAYGFGDKTSQNLIDQLAASRSIAIEDWRFLAAFGVSRLGAGNCERLLEHHSLADIFDVTVADMVQIDGFAQLSAEAIVEGLTNIKNEFFKVYQLGFNLTATEKLTAGGPSDSAIAGKTIVFTGSMQQGSRADMEKQAKLLGAKVAKSVSGKTDYLVTGDKVGANKINAARDKGVEVISEAEYLDLIAS
ncbi:BRCT domain-containing protein [Gayadomonas joobiniege]|uniref:BRCT domain-containing protein n=1 Tax=Gayadomonas joobiniege TaxID=1234606 RepID=UPI00037FAA67|nr:helix-hairpin-helix domain-containing protein [Gayadomonas joobiniege]